MEKMLSAEIWTIVKTGEGNAVLLRPRGRNVAVPIFVGQLEVQSIIIGKEGLSLPRPLTHDLLLDLLDSQGLVLDRVEIHDLKDNTFHARLVIIGGKYTDADPMLLDSRPSDAFGLATRRKCPILVSTGVVKETGIPLDLFVDALENDDVSSAGRAASSEVSSSGKKRLKLLEQLDEAVDKEEYEEAARIRDLLKAMEEENG
jgi:bifunctional DNase/RNase